MATGSEIIKYIESLAPLETQDTGDTSGLQLGDPYKDVGTLGIMFEADLPSIGKAVELKCDMIITHHPMHLGEAKNITGVRYQRMKRLAENDICVYSAHTTWDLAKGGTTDTLAKILGVNVAEKEKFLAIGSIKKTSLGELAKNVGLALGNGRVEAIGDPDRKIQNVAVCAGAGLVMDELEMLEKYRIDAYISADPREYALRYARDMGIAIINAGHYQTENPGIQELARLITKKFPKLEVIFINSGAMP